MPDPLPDARETDNPSTGNLTPEPALTHPDLLAPPVARALRSDQDAGFARDVRVAAIDPTLADTAQFCAAYGVDPGISANCVVVAGKRGGVTTLAACLVLATTRADVNGTVRRHLGARKVSFASMDTAVAESDMEYGGITPVGLPAEWPLLIDARAVELPQVVVGSGLRGSKLWLPGRALANLPGAQVLDGLALSP